MKIDRLTLHTGPLTDREAHELAQLVAEAVATLPLPPAGAVRVQVPAPAQGGVASLRDAIVKAVEAAFVARAPAAGGAGRAANPGGGRS
ncbi:hypothetical protein [Microbacterium deminutum]|uniref:Uncharacterized protein n=1 Tax=Microbacterium deminutum TaxID=344164 RepID=A0ABP5C190_9MICO